LSIKRFAIALVKYGLLAAALVVTAGLSALTTMRVVLRTQEVVVPSLVGKPLPEAGALAARRRLVLRVEGRRNDPKLGRDLIVEQEPAAGSGIKRQRSVRVWVSLGPRRLMIPAVEGESVRSGRLLLDQAQVPVGRVIEVSDGAEEGTILQQHPPTGETDTLAAEGASGLKVTEVRYRSYPGAAAGLVLRQAPLSGYRVNPHTAISLDVSQSGP
jgi:beta-lactam-binding protein with PASTA domain